MGGRVCGGANGRDRLARLGLLLQERLDVGDRLEQTEHGLEGELFAQQELAIRVGRAKVCAIDKVADGLVNWLLACLTLHCNCLSQHERQHELHRLHNGVQSLLPQLKVLAFGGRPRLNAGSCPSPRTLQTPKAAVSPALSPLLRQVSGNRLVERRESPRDLKRLVDFLHRRVRQQLHHKGLLRAFA